MITTRKFLGLGAAVTIGTLLACANDSTAPVGPDRVFTSLEMQPPAFTLATIDGLKAREIHIRAKDQYGVDMVDGAPSFSSSDPAVATMTDIRWMTAVGPGEAVMSVVVTAMAPGEADISVSWTIAGITKTATTKVTVESTEGWSLKVDPAGLTLPVASREEVQATVVDETGKIKMKLGPYAAFTSDRNDVVALVEECAMTPCPNAVYVLGVASGEATITAEYSGLSGTAIVTVVP